MSSWALQWRHGGRDSVSNHQPRECLLSRLIRRRSKKTSKLRATGLCAGNSPETGEFPTQRASNAENVSIWWRHHGEKEFLHINLTIKPSFVFHFVSKYRTTLISHDGGFMSQRVNYVELLCFRCCQLEQAVGQAVELPVILKCFYVHVMSL